MRAVAIQAFGSPDGLAVIDVADPVPAAGQVLIETEAIGVGGVDAVIHLAGASIAGRFTDSHRDAVRDSRIGPTRRLAELLVDSAERPAVLISASAIGFYGYDRGDEILTEDSDRGDGFLADVLMRNKGFIRD